MLKNICIKQEGSKFEKIPLSLLCIIILSSRFENEINKKRLGQIKEKGAAGYHLGKSNIELG